ncbi:EAL domain-containing protein [Lysobacter yangpyeongensis]|uniref:EAL domain-containing protein n=1 Tax=Lysobacter yangpyeongensis TaxID=346182 RepID=A0ABW0SMM5_9GAMM
MTIPCPLKVLLVEDSSADAELIAHILRKLGTEVEFRRVDNAFKLRATIAEFAPHVILSDFTMPGFSGHDALEVVSEVAPEVPFVFVSNTIGEDVAIEALQRGAADYVLKDNLRRLPPAVERALRTAQERNERERMERALRESEERYRSIVESSQDWIWETDRDGRLSYSNGAVERVLGHDAASIGGRPWATLLHADDRGLADALMREADAAAPWQDLRLRFVHRDGSVRVLESTGMPLRDGEGHTIGFRGLNHDVTAHLAQESRIQHLARLHAVLSALGNAVLRAGTRQGVLDAACRVAVEQGGFLGACIRQLGDAEASIVSSYGDDRALDAVLAVSRRARAMPDAAQWAPALRALNFSAATIVSDLATDTRIPAWARQDWQAGGIHAQAVLPVGAPPWAAIGLYAGEAQRFGEEEIALFERLADEIDFAVQFISKSEQLEYLAYHNPVSGLPNRAAFQKRLRERLKQGPMMVALTDVDRFAAINESHGRAFGDALLRELGRRLCERMGEEALVAHLEADTFAVACSPAGGTEDEAARLDDLLQAIHHEPFAIDGREVRIELRAGFVLTQAGEDPEALEHHAAAALLEGERRKLRTYAFGDELRGRASRRLELEHELRAAIEEEQFELFYQPKFNTATQNLIGAEALIRWRHPERGLLAPGEFISVLEESTLIVQAGHWAMRKALHTALQWREWHPGFRIAVNVSAQELHHSGFLDGCRGLLLPHVADQPLDIEITESVLVDDIEHSMHVLDALRDLGCRVSIDDFGTGYSSLNYLARLPSDEIKIDRSFIALITESPETMALVTNIIGLAHSLSLKVVAEGVEEHEQAKLLRLLRCDVLQGYLLGRPMSAEAFESALLAGTAQET